MRDSTGHEIQASALVEVERNNQKYINSTNLDTGITLYSLDENWHVSTRSQPAPSLKSGPEHPSDVIAFEIGVQSFVVAASQSDGRLSAYRLNDGGQLEFTYMLAPADGLWVDGLDTIIPLTGGGQSYVIGVSAGASALVAVRLNPMGVFFVSDIVHDTRDTRFDDATTLTSFEAGGRSFVVTGGSDAGV